MEDSQAGDTYPGPRNTPKVMFKKQNISRELGVTLLGMGEQAGAKQQGSNPRKKRH